VCFTPLLLLLLLQGEYCLQLKMDILPGSGIAAVGAQTVAVPSAPQSITRQVRHQQILQHVVQQAAGAVVLVQLGKLIQKRSAPAAGMQQRHLSATATDS
jgi:hypothetical protein